MKKMKQILNIIDEARKASFWISKIEEIVLKGSLEDVYEIRFYVNEEKLLNEFDVDVDAVTEAIDHFLIPNLRKDFIANIKEVNYLYDDVEIVIVCEDVL